MKSIIISAVLIFAPLSWGKMTDEQVRAQFCKDPRSNSKYKVFENFDRLTKYADRAQAQAEAQRRTQGLQTPAQLLPQIGQAERDFKVAEEEFYDLQKEAGLMSRGDPTYKDVADRRNKAAKKMDSLKVKTLDLEAKVDEFYKKRGAPIWYAADKKAKTDLGKLFKFECAGTIYTTNSEYVAKDVVDGDLEAPAVEHKFGTQKLMYTRYACMNGGSLQNAIVVQNGKIKGELVSQNKGSKVIFYDVGSYKDVPTKGSPGREVAYGSPHTTTKLGQPAYMYNESSMSLAIQGKVVKGSLRAPSETVVTPADPSKMIVRTLVDKEPKEITCGKNLEIRKLKDVKGILNNIIPNSY